MAEMVVMVKMSVVYLVSCITIFLNSLKCKVFIDAFFLLQAIKSDQSIYICNGHRILILVSDY